MLTLYHAPKSRSSRIIWLLEELGAPYTIKMVDIPRMDMRLPLEVARLQVVGASDPANPHPDKKVPALLDDGVLITESIAICLYLTDKFPAAGIGPQVGDPKRGPYLTWLAYYAGVIEPVVNLHFAGLGDNPLLQSAWGGREKLDARILAALRAGPYLLGDRFTAADVVIASLGQFSRELMPGDAIVDAYLERVNSRPALARALAKDNG